MASPSTPSLQVLETSPSSPDSSLQVLGTSTLSPSSRQELETSQPSSPDPSLQVLGTSSPSILHELDTNPDLEMKDLVELAPLSQRPKSFQLKLRRGRPKIFRHVGAAFHKDESSEKCTEPKRKRMDPCQKQSSIASSKPTIATQQSQESIPGNQLQAMGCNSRPTCTEDSKNDVLQVSETESSLMPTAILQDAQPLFSDVESEGALSECECESDRSESDSVVYVADDAKPIASDDVKLKRPVEESTLPEVIIIRCETNNDHIHCSLNLIKFNPNMLCEIYELQNEFLFVKILFRRA